MPAPRRAVIGRIVVAAISILVAVATGLEWVGKPFRLVELLTLVGLGAMAGVSWMQAVAGAKEFSRARLEEPKDGSRPSLGA